MDRYKQLRQQDNIEYNLKTIALEEENYEMVKAKYLRGECPVNQLADAQQLYLKAKIDAINSPKIPLYFVCINSL